MRSGWMGMRAQLCFAYTGTVYPSTPTQWNNGATIRQTPHRRRRRRRRRRSLTGANEPTMNQPRDIQRETCVCAPNVQFAISFIRQTAKPAAISTSPVPLSSGRAVLCQTSVISPRSPDEVQAKGLPHTEFVLFVFYKLGINILDANPVDSAHCGECSRGNRKKVAGSRHSGRTGAKPGKNNSPKRIRLPAFSYFAMIRAIISITCFRRPLGAASSRFG